MDILSLCLRNPFDLINTLNYSFFRSSKKNYSNCDLNCINWLILNKKELINKNVLDTVFKLINYNDDRWDILCSLCYNTDLSLVKHWLELNKDYRLETYLKTPDIQSYEINIYNNYEKFSYIKFALMESKFSIVFYLCEKINSNIWVLLINNAWYKIFKECKLDDNFYRNLCSINITSSNVDNIFSLDYFFIYIVKNNIQIIRFLNFILKNNSNNYIIDRYISICIEYKKYYNLKYLFSNYKGNLTNIFIYNNKLDKVIPQSLMFQEDKAYIKRSKNILAIFCLIINYIKKNNPEFDIKSILNPSIICRLATLHNSLSSFKLINRYFESYDIYDYESFNPLIDCARYGIFPTFYYLYNRTKFKHITTNCYLKLNILSASFYNKDTRILEFILEKNKDNLEIFNISHCIIHSKGLVGEKIFKKLLIINKYHNIKYYLIDILNASFCKNIDDVIDFFKETILFNNDSLCESKDIETCNDLNDFFLNSKENTFKHLNFIIKYVKKVFPKSYMDFIKNIWLNIIHLYKNDQYYNSDKYYSLDKYYNLVKKNIDFSTMDSKFLGDIIAISYLEITNKILDVINDIKYNIGADKYNILVKELSIKLKDTYFYNKNLIYLYFLIGVEFETFDVSEVRSTFKNYIDSVIKARITLKKLISKKISKQKRSHCSNFTSIIDELKFSPYINLDNSFTSNSLRHSVNPEHIKPKHILNDNFLFNNTLYLSQKADGFPKKINNLKCDLYPPIINCRIELQTEYIESLGIYLVYDICNDNYIDLTYTEKYKFLSEKHRFIKPDTDSFSSLDNLIDYKTSIQNRFKEFVKLSKSDTTKKYWWPKKVWKINLNGESLIKTISELVDLELNIYPTDGWILNDLNNIYKLKPKKHLTIDLKYNMSSWYDKQGNIYDIKNDKLELKDNSIYRCYFLNNNLVAKDIRTDKKKPNPRDIVNLVMDMHKDNYSIEYLNNFLNTPYYHNFEIKRDKQTNKVTSLLLSLKKTDTVLDIGCGYNYFYNKKIINGLGGYLGIDKDYKIYNKFLDENVDNKFILSDICKEWDRETLVNKKKIYEKYSIILVNNCIHYTVQNNKIPELFVKQIEKHSSLESKIYITYCEKDELKGIFKDVKTIHDGCNYVTLLDNDTIKYYYAWTHLHPNIEKLVSLNMIKTAFNNYTIESVNNVEYKKKITSKCWSKYLDCFKQVVLKRSIN